MSHSAPTPEQAAEIMAEAKADFPDLVDLMRELYRAGMIEGTRNIGYVEIAATGRQFGNPSEEGVEPYVPRVCFRCGQAIDYTTNQRHMCRRK